MPEFMSKWSIRLETAKGDFIELFFESRSDASIFVAQIEMAKHIECWPTNGLEISKPELRAPHGR
jgi:hypothetical protein